jgi:hypothetical protein
MAARATDPLTVGGRRACQRLSACRRAGKRGGRTLVPVDEDRLGDDLVGRDLLDDLVVGRLVNNDGVVGLKAETGKGSAWSADDDEQEGPHHARCATQTTDGEAGIQTLSFTLPFDHFFFFWAFPTPEAALALGGWWERAGATEGSAACGRDAQGGRARATGSTGSSGSKQQQQVGQVRRQAAERGVEGGGRGVEGGRNGGRRAQVSSHQSAPRCLAGSRRFNLTPGARPGPGTTPLRLAPGWFVEEKWEATKVGAWSAAAEGAPRKSDKTHRRGLRSTSERVDEVDRMPEGACQGLPAWLCCCVRAAAAALRSCGPSRGVAGAEGERDRPS